MHSSVSSWNFLGKLAVQNHVVFGNEKHAITGFVWPLLAVTSMAGALCLRMFYTGNKPGLSSTILHGTEWFVSFFLKVGISHLPDGFADGEF